MVRKEQSWDVIRGKSQSYELPPTGMYGKFPDHLLPDQY